MKNYGKITENQMETIRKPTEIDAAHGIPRKSLRKSSRNLKNIKRRTKRGNIGKTRGEPEGKPLEKPLGHHRKIKGTFMESTLGC